MGYRDAPELVSSSQCARDGIECVAQRRLDQSSYPALRRLTCHCDGRRLVIRGRVPNYYHKQLAQANLADLSTQIEIVNETVVDFPQNSSQTESEIW